MKEILTKNFENGPVQSMQLFGYYRANASMDFYPDDEDLMYGFNDINKKFSAKTQKLCSYKLKFNFKSDSNILNYLNGKEFLINCNF